MQTTYPHASGYPLRCHPQAPQPPSPQQASRHPPVGRPLPPGSATLTPTSGVGVKMMTATTRGTSCTHARAKAVASAERTWGMAMSCRRKECAGHLRVEAHVIDLDRGLERAMQRLERKEGIDLAPPLRGVPGGRFGQERGRDKAISVSIDVRHIFRSIKDTKSGGVGALHPPLHSRSCQTQAFVGKFIPT